MPSDFDTTAQPDDVARLFREHDNIGPDSSFWLRPLRQLLHQGKPLGPALLLVLKPADGNVLPFGILTLTQKSRIVFWPALPPDADMVCAGTQISVLDHITLEFPGEKTHITAYHADGTPVHNARSWRLHHFCDNGVALWFNLLAKYDLLANQPCAVQRKVRTPSTDKQRREGELERFVQNLSVANITIPPLGGDYFCIGIYVATRDVTEQDLTASIFQIGCNIDTLVTGWTDGEYVLARSKARLQDTTFVAMVASPPGTLNTDVAIGFPRSTT